RPAAARCRRRRGLRHPKSARAGTAPAASVSRYAAVRPTASLAAPAAC
ncbi:hypothetical protein BFDFBN_BFDFBN_17740, partial [Dysosmobacter welbionis]